MYMIWLERVSAARSRRTVNLTLRQVNQDTMMMATHVHPNSGMPRSFRSLVLLIIEVLAPDMGVLQSQKMAEKNHQFDLNVNLFECNDTQQMIVEASDQTTENDYQDVNLLSDPLPKRKRHAKQQVKQLEEFFNECPNPDSEQRKALSLVLGLEPAQVKFWFQKKRTQTKVQRDHQKCLQLQAENTRLKADRLRYKETLENAKCHDCGGPLTLCEMWIEEHQLRLENALLKRKINKLSAIVANITGHAFPNCDNFPPPAAS